MRGHTTDIYHADQIFAVEQGRQSYLPNDVIWN